MTERAKGLSRRNFLLAAGAAGAATAAAAAVRNAPPAPSASGGGKRATRGYQASEHVNTYYRTAKV